MNFDYLVQFLEAALLSQLGLTEFGRLCGEQGSANIYFVNYCRWLAWIRGSLGVGC